MHDEWRLAELPGDAGRHERVCFPNVPRPPWIASPIPTRRPPASRTPVDVDVGVSSRAPLPGRPTADRGATHSPFARQVTDVLATDTREVEDLALGTRWRCTRLGRITDPGLLPFGPTDSFDLVMCLGGGPFAVLKLREGELSELEEWELLARITHELRCRAALPDGIAGAPPLGAH